MKREAPVDPCATCASPLGPTCPRHLCGVPRPMRQEAPVASKKARKGRARVKKIVDLGADTVE